MLCRGKRIWWSNCPSAQWSHPKVNHNRGTSPPFLKQYDNGYAITSPFWNAFPPVVQFKRTAGSSFSIFPDGFLASQCRFESMLTQPKEGIFLPVLQSGYWFWIVFKMFLHFPFPWLGTNSHYFRLHCDHVLQTMSHSNGLFYLSCTIELWYFCSNLDLEWE